MADALYVGLELLTRFGVAVEGPRILYREVWPTYLCAPLAAAATASRMLGLTAAQTANALSIALALTAGGSGRFDHGTSPRWVLHAVAVRAGCLAARAAGAGFGGDLDLLDRNWLEASHGVALRREILFDGLGQGPSAYTQLSIKPFCSAKQAIAAMQAFRELLDEGLDPQTARRITVRVPPAYAKMIDRRPEAGSRSSTFASARYQMALAAFRPDGLFEIGRDAPQADARMTALMDKIEIAPDEQLAPLYPKAWPASVTVETESGVRERRVIDALGDPANRLSAAALLDKAKRVLEPLAGAQAAEEIRVAGAALGDRASAVDYLRRFEAAVAG
jgi:2-methylcitrate dehydratase PrpD